MPAVTLNHTLTHDAPAGANVYAVALTIPIAHDTIPADKSALTSFVLEHANTPEYRHAVVTMQKSTSEANKYTATFMQALDSVSSTVPPNKFNIAESGTSYHTYVVVENKNTDLINRTALHVYNSA